MQWPLRSLPPVEVDGSVVEVTVPLTTRGISLPEPVRCRHASRRRADNLGQVRSFLLVSVRAEDPSLTTLWAAYIYTTRCWRGGSFSPQLICASPAPRVQVLASECLHGLRYAYILTVLQLDLF